MNHLEDQLLAYLDNELTEEEKLAVEAHLESCASCQALLQDWLSFQAQVHDAFQYKQAPIDFDIHVMQAIQQEQRVTIRKRWLLLPLLAGFIFILFGITRSMMVVKFIHSFIRLLSAFLYMSTHFMASIPIISATAVFLSIFVLFTSIYYLRRAIRLTSMEGG
ncbi:hypothetical protein PCCS19_38350 [Paenibacillus sp. CCS19]|uniref:anti-sigma factor family protein n=1 Tax=Paenibacillus sp. CCS19 TaxID=3158387 RepID=UPI00256ADD3C|nr:zf-HC2 domain-containing protein [Paenibacillus cellulosilyticus]GMK40779.1 hypothetical protein PCCS19_38350 [Paenibacillus cellulosilyticus]